MSWKLFVQHFTAATQSVIAGIATAGLAPVCLATTESCLYWINDHFPKLKSRNIFI